jgi:hypothetical protein
LDYEQQNCAIRAEGTTFSEASKDVPNKREMNIWYT